MSTETTNNATAAAVHVLKLGALCSVTVLAIGMLVLLLFANFDLVHPSVLQKAGEVLIYLCPTIFVVFALAAARRAARK